MANETVPNNVLPPGVDQAEATRGLARETIDFVDRVIDQQTANNRVGPKKN
jgi:hypothetical protein